MTHQQVEMEEEEEGEEEVDYWWSWAGVGVRQSWQGSLRGPSRESVGSVGAAVSSTRRPGVSQRRQTTQWMTVEQALVQCAGVVCSFEGRSGQ